MTAKVEIEINKAVQAWFKYLEASVQLGFSQSTLAVKQQQSPNLAWSTELYILIEKDISFKNLQMQKVAKISFPKNIFKKS